MTKTEKTASKTTSSKKRYILFVGNLAFSTTKESVKTFVGVPSAEVRLMTKKGSSESRGAAFVELTSFDDFKKVLQLSGKSLDGRTVRVEPTAGGGGTGAVRKDKIKSKKETLLNDIKKVDAAHKAKKQAAKKPEKKE